MHKMSLTKDLSTEEHIKTMARSVFIEKGYDATSVRDIAQASDSNVALINYYFRSKEKLFNAIFEEVAIEFFGSLIHVFNQDIPLRQKFEILIEKDIEFLLKNPEIPNFMMNQLKTNDKDFFDKFLKKERLVNSLMVKQMEIAVQNGEMRNLKFYEIITLIMSNIQFLFIAKPIIAHMGSLEDTQFIELVNIHKERVKEMVLGYIFMDNR
jgi:TetR/AcrR family transcriptional regulator